MLQYILIGSRNLILPKRWVVGLIVKREQEELLNDVLSTMREVFPRVEVITFTPNKTGNETAEMIQECRVLFGVHGAGHTNAIYAGPGVAVNCCK